MLQYTNNTDEAMICQIVAHLGDGTNDLDGSGGDFELTLQFGSQTNMPDPQLVYFNTAGRASVFTEQFVLPVNETVTARIRSPNAADTAVWTYCCIYEVTDLSKMSFGISPTGTITNIYTDSGGVYSNA